MRYDPSNKNNSKKEQMATTGDLLSASVIIVMLAGIVTGIVKSGAHLVSPINTKSAGINLDSLVQDSLVKTIEYQDAVRANKKVEEKQADIRNYFNAKTINH